MQKAQDHSRVLVMIFVFDKGLQAAYWWLELDSDC
jgi:hypothetical protein